MLSSGLGRHIRAGQDSTCVDMSGVEKAAVLLASIGAAASAEVFKLLDRDQIARLTAGIASMPAADASRRAAVLEEFERARAARDNGRGAAVAVLESMMSCERVAQLHTTPAPGRTFNDIASLDGTSIASMLAAVGHRTFGAALVGAEPAVRASVLGRLPREDRARLRAETDEAGLVRLREIEQAQSRCLEALSGAAISSEEVAV